MAYLPIQVPPGHRAYQLAVHITSEPGPIVSISEGWALVDRGTWGQFGCPVQDLTPAVALTPAPTVRSG